MIDFLCRKKSNVFLKIFNESFERMERVLEGFQLGFTASLNNLEKLLTNLSQK